MRVKLSQLSIIVERSAPPIPRPRRELEQYPTPGELAARAALVLAMRMGGRFEDAWIADLGAGTCRLSIALALLGATRIAAVEADTRLLPLCAEASARAGVWGAVQPVAGRITRSSGPLRRADAVIMNPPFGVWRRGADTDFLLYAMSIGASPIVAILKHGNIEYFRRISEERGYRVESVLEYMFPIPASMTHHRSRIKRIRVEVLVFERAD